MSIRRKENGDGWTTYDVDPDSTTYERFKVIHGTGKFNPFNPWVVEMANGEVAIVDGNIYPAGTEPMIAGPFSSVEEAKRVAHLLAKLEK